ncbi:MAG: SurA N-terminal domain-containing protein [Thiohalobacterales bacterium]|nr:SurA N-terminal domain-containing protein [Thiohalobacterales bacterium]
MLLAIRERIMGVLGWIILGLIFIAFAFWGLDSYLQSSAVNYAASVNDVEIPLRQHDLAYQQLRERMREALGNNMERAGFTEEKLRASSLERLISDELMIQAADSAGFAVADQIVAAEINSVEAFRKDGVFSKERYQQVLGYQGMSPGRFEWQLKREIIANQLKTGIALTAAVTDDALARLISLERQQRRFDHLVLPVALVEGQVEVSDADLEAYYNENGSRFMTPERVRIQYLELNAAELELDTAVEEAEIEALYEEQAERFVTPEERRARHILVSTPDSSEAAINSARARIEEIVRRLDAGEDFAAVATETSDDAASAASGGDLGFFGTGVMTPGFEQAVFALEVGERSDPVQTPFGFHVIELTEIRPEQRTPLAEVRDELVRELQSGERADLFFEQSDLMANIAFEQPDSLEPVAEALGMTISESDWFGRDGGEGIAVHNGVVEASYSEDVLGNGNNSTTIEIGEDHIVVLRVLEHQVPMPQPFDEVRDTISDLVRDEKIRTLLEEQGEAWITDLRQGSKAFTDVAAAAGTEVQEHPLTSRDAGSPDRAIISQAFSLPPPDGDTPVYSGFHAARGGYVIVALHEVRDGVIDELSEEQRTQARRGMTRFTGTGEVLRAQAELHSKASIVIPADDDQ